MKVIITGGAGFIGSHCVEHFLRKTDWDIIILDKLTYASMGLARLRDSEVIYSPRVRVFTWDLCIPLSEGLKREIGDDVNLIFHLAAESHVDNSIQTPIKCIQNNVMSTIHMYEYARSLKHLHKIFQFSTDEVYGAATHDIAFKEWDRHKPTNPYSASKSAGDKFAIAYHNTYNLPIVTINCMNAFGERQHSEKFIPKVIKKILNDEVVDIHADKTCTISGSRTYIHCRNIASTLLFLVEHAENGDRYNIKGNEEISNLDLALFISKVMNKELKYRLIDAETNRPAHDLRYMLDDFKLKQMGCEVSVDFYKTLENTIKWTLNHLKWLEE